MNLFFRVSLATSQSCSAVQANRRCKAREAAELLRFHWHVWRLSHFQGSLSLSFSVREFPCVLDVRNIATIL